MVKYQGTHTMEKKYRYLLESVAPRKVGSLPPQTLVLMFEDKLFKTIFINTIMPVVTKGNLDTEIKILLCQTECQAFNDKFTDLIEETFSNYVKDNVHRMIHLERYYNDGLEESSTKDDFEVKLHYFWGEAQIMYFFDTDRFSYKHYLKLLHKGDLDQAKRETRSLTHSFIKLTEIFNRDTIPIHGIISSPEVNSLALALELYNINNSVDVSTLYDGLGVCKKELECYSPNRAHGPCTACVLKHHFKSNLSKTNKKILSRKKYVEMIKALDLEKFKLFNDELLIKQDIYCIKGLNDIVVDKTFIKRLESFHGKRFTTIPIFMHEYHKLLK